MNSFVTLLSWFIPECILIFFATLILLYGLYESKVSFYKQVELIKKLMYYAGNTCFFIFFFIWLFFNKLTSGVMDYQVAPDYFSYSMKILLFLFSGIIFMLSAGYFRFEKKIKAFEIPVVMLLSCLGMSLLISSNNFAIAYLAMELQSLSIYAIITAKRDTKASSEAAFKYFVLGVISSAIFLLGVSFLYAYTGTISFLQLKPILSYVVESTFLLGDTALPSNLSYGIIFSISLILVGVFFKLSVVPFHIWTPEIYRKAPTPMVLFLAILPKVSMWAFFMRLYFYVFSDFLPKFSLVIQACALLSLLVGSLGALRQARLRAIIAYSAIANMGFILLGLSTFSVGGYKASLVYLIIYSIITMCNFSVILAVRCRYGEKLFYLKNVITLLYTHPFTGIVFVINLFSIAGIPPLAGFFGKFFVIQSLMASNMVFAAVTAVVLSAISCFYYLRLIVYMIVESDYRFSRYRGDGIPEADLMDWYMKVDFVEDKQYYTDMSTILVVSMFFMACFNVLFFLFPSLIIDSAWLMVKSFME